MNEQKNNGRGIFYGVIGVATLVVAIIGATFAYFTATAANNVITGNMATVKLALAVKKVSTADDGIGMIPMSNSMVEPAVSNASTKGICLDNNGNPVCQIYKITLTNDSSAGQFVDGYVALKGGSGIPTDYNEYPDVVADATTQAKWPMGGLGTDAKGDPVGTTMRWAQVFPTFASGAGSIVDPTKDLDGDNVCEDGEPGCEHKVTKYSTIGTQALGTDTSVEFTSLGNQGLNPDDAKNLINIRTENELMTTESTTLVNDLDGDKVCDTNGDDARTEGTTESNFTEIGCTKLKKGVIKSVNISGTDYDVIGTNYIRVSNHQWLKAGGAESYSRNNDITSALVFNHNISAKKSADYYVAVWLSETGTNQTAGSTVSEGVTLPDDEAFFMGNVTFVSAQGSEVSATFANHARVSANG